MNKNTEMIQLRMDSLEDDHPENQLRDSMGIQSPRKKNERCFKKFCNHKIIRGIWFIILCCLFGIIGLSIAFAEGYSGVKLFEWIDGNRSSYPQARELTASAWPHSYSTPMSCSSSYNPGNGDYGCCSIYDRRGSYNISWNRILKDDKEGSNCPSYEHLIHNYVEYVHKYLSPINCSEVSCCKLNYRIDLSFRENGTFPRNPMDPDYDIEIPVSNNYYSCRPLKVIIAYQNHYKDPSMDDIIYIILIAIIIYVLYKTRPC